MSGVHIMACAPEETQSPELLALEKNSSTLCRGITSISTVTDFALLLVEQSFITYSASRSILRTTGISEQEKCNRFLDAVREQVRTDCAKFESFVGILRQEPALTCYTDILINSRGQKCMWMHTICWNGLVCMCTSTTQFACMYIVVMSLELLLYVRSQ